ncbi:transcription factor bHLH30-like [Aristolochia californica]|uniref:transcription factor bHLH30-like n=1 Tax=Aristolochia californica TaxID=171875 RepID=UPI0035D89ABB
MASFSGDFGLNCGSRVPRVFSGYSQTVGFKATERSGSSCSSSLVLDSEKRELVTTPVRLGPKGVAEAKAKTALKSHSEAERRRRERINAHLTTLRSIVPSTGKMDKAALLEEVISHVKELKRHAAEISKRYVIPTEVDEVKVEPDVDEVNTGTFLIKASLCCEDRPELLTDLKQTLQSLSLKTVRAEISTLGGRLKNVFVMACEGNTDEIERRVFVSTIHQALKAVLDRVSSSEFSAVGELSNKRTRLSLLESFSSSS